MNGSPLRIVILDSSPVHVGAIGRSLKAANAAVEISVAANLQTFRSLLAESPPDIAQVDL